MSNDEDTQYEKNSSASALRWRRSSALRLFLKVGASVFGFWVLVFTPVWSYVTDAAVHLISDLSTISNDSTKDFRTNLKQSPILQFMCNESNWLADKTRPLAKDDAMLDLWQAKHKQWEEMILTSPEMSRRDAENTPNLAKQYGLKVISGSKNGISESIYLTPTETVGRVDSERACNGKGRVSKHFEYYPNQIPVHLDGRVMTSKQHAFFLEHRGRPPWPSTPGWPLVKDTDTYPREFVVMRSLSERWYIVHRSTQ